MQENAASHPQWENGCTFIRMHAKVLLERKLALLFNYDLFIGLFIGFFHTHKYNKPHACVSSTGVYSEWRP